MMKMKKPHLPGQIPDPTRQNCVLGNSRELLVGIESRMSNFVAYSKPPTARLHPNG